ncbi:MULTISPECIES: hypothetical protein [Streptomyces]|uniref:hypothetical protein n=1 Tax=Streptomyces TaxID=1883 RepID=UPI00292FD5DF|nr:hypothetical protein [Streptomyces sp. NEAU-HV9]
MEPVSLIVAALAAGAAAGVSDAAKESVVAAYRQLREAVRARLAGRPDGRLILERFEEQPDTWERPLRAELAASGVDAEEALIALARRVLAEAGRDDRQGAKYQTHFHGRVGNAVVGDSAHVDMTVHESGPGPDQA